MNTPLVMIFMSAVVLMLGCGQSSSKTGEHPRGDTDSDTVSDDTAADSNGHGDTGDNGDTHTDDGTGAQGDTHTDDDTHTNTDENDDTDTGTTSVEDTGADSDIDTADRRDSDTDNKPDTDTGNDTGRDSENDTAGDTQTDTAVIENPYEFTLFHCSGTIYLPTDIRHMKNAPGEGMVVMGRIWDIASAYLVEEQFLTCTPEDPYTECLEASYTTDSGATVTYAYQSYATGDTAMSDAANETVETIAILGESLDWRNLEITRSDKYTQGDISEYTSHSYTASWTGTLDPDWPVDGEASAFTSDSWDDTCTYNRDNWQTPDCSVYFKDGDCGDWSLDVNGNALIDFETTKATLHGECVGKIDRSTFEITGPCEDPPVVEPKPLLPCNDRFCFALGESVLTGENTQNLKVVDCNHDGMGDVIVTNSETDTISVNPGNGDGTFGIQYNFAAGESPRAFDTGDFNGDGHVDVAVGNFFNGAHVLMGDGTCRFGDPTVLMGENPLGQYSSGGKAVAAMDANGDGDEDIVVSVYAGSDSELSGNYLAIVENDGAGNFSWSADRIWELYNQIEAIEIADVDRDGVLDMMVLTSFVDGRFFNVEIVEGLGNGDFDTPHKESDAGNCGPRMADFNEDGILDFATVGDEAAIVNIGTGNGYFDYHDGFDLGTTDAKGIAVDDLDNDGHQDLVVAFAKENAVGILLGKGDGTFELPVIISAVSETPATDYWLPKDLALHDINDDSRLDILVTNYYGSVSVLLSTALAMP